MKSKNSPFFPDNISEHLHGLELGLAQLLNRPAIKFDRNCRHALPETQGVYRIFDPDAPNDTMRAGRTNGAAEGLRQRVYQNHLMGNQPGNLRAQLVNGKVCEGLEAAKEYIRTRLVVQILEVEDSRERIWLEHYMLGVLRPLYCN